MIDELDSLRHENAERQRSRLLAERPEHGTNWWLAIIGVAANNAVSPLTPEEDRPQWAALAVVALDAARDLGDLDGREVVSRRTNLSLALSRYGPPESFSAALRPDAVAGASLAEAGMTPEEAASTPWQYRDEDIDVMRRLRRVRNVVYPAVQLADRVEDEQLRQTLAAWREVLPKLP
jgi:hypothetical protein